MLSRERAQRSAIAGCARLGQPAVLVHRARVRTKSVGVQAEVAFRRPPQLREDDLIPLREPRDQKGLVKGTMHHPIVIRAFLLAEQLGQEAEDLGNLRIGKEGPCVVTQLAFDEAPNIVERFQIFDGRTGRTHAAGGGCLQEPLRLKCPHRLPHGNVAHAKAFGDRRDRQALLGSDPARQDIIAKLVSNLLGKTVPTQWGGHGVAI